MRSIKPCILMLARSSSTVAPSIPGPGILKVLDPEGSPPTFGHVIQEEATAGKLRSWRVSIPRARTLRSCIDSATATTSVAGADLPHLRQVREGDLN
jgi:hypothetical protein